MTGVLVETDVIVEYLTAPPGEATLLRRLLASVPCFSTFVQASEVYAACVDDEERAVVERALFGLKILGASARYSKTIGLLLTSSGPMRGHRTAIVAAVAIESRLPVVTDTHFDAYSSVSGLRLAAASELRCTTNGEELMKALERSSSRVSSHE